MATFTNTSKTAVAVFSKASKAGAGWNYDQIGITYDGATDANSGYTVYYNALNTAITYTNTSKNSASFTNVAKN